MKYLLLSLIATLCTLVPVSARTATVCPDGMVKVPGHNSCLDQYEWPNQQGKNPIVGMPAVPLWQDELTASFNAKALCESVGKRLCSVDEWINSCEGPEGAKYPFGNELPDLRYTTPENAPCNYAQWYIGRNELAIQRRDPNEFERLWQGDRSGERGCVSASGAEDMMGNVEEWVSCRKRRADGRVTESMCLMGRFWSEPRTCNQVLRTHDPKYFDYETGTRCCADPIRATRVAIIPEFSIWSPGFQPFSHLDIGAFDDFR